MVLQVRNREPFCHTITDDELPPGLRNQVRETPSRPRSSASRSLF